MTILGKHDWYLSEYQFRKFDQLFAILSQWAMIMGHDHISASGYHDTMINWYIKPRKCIAITIFSMVLVVVVGEWWCWWLL